MAIKNIEKLMKKHTKEGVVDFAAVEAAVNEQVNGIVMKNKPDMDKIKSDVKNEAINEFVGDLGLENIKTQDQFKAFHKNITDKASDKDVKIAEATRLASEAKTELATMKAEHGELSNFKLGVERQSLVTKAGFKSEFAQEITTLASANVTEEKTFDMVIKEYSESEKYNGWKSTTKPKPETTTNQQGEQGKNTADEGPKGLFKNAFSLIDKVK